MDFIIDFIDFLYTTITNLVDFVLGLIDNLFMLVQYVGVVADICYQTIAGMPTWLQAFGTLTVVVSVLFMIIGRDNGGNN